MLSSKVSHTREFGCYESRIIVAGRLKNDCVLETGSWVATMSLEVHRTQHRTVFTDKRALWQPWGRKYSNGIWQKTTSTMTFSENVDVRELWKNERSIYGVEEAHQPLWNKTKNRKSHFSPLTESELCCRRMTIWVWERNCRQEFLFKVMAELFSWFQCSNKCNKSPPIRLQGETSSENSISGKTKRLCGGSFL